MCTFRTLIYKKVINMMNNPFKHIQDILNLSGKEASLNRQPEVKVEHIMLSMLCQQNGEVTTLLQRAGIDVESFKEYLTSSLNITQTSNPGSEQMESIPFNNLANMVIRSSIREAFINDHTNYVEPRHILLAILRDGSSDVAQQLSSLGVDYETISDMLSIEPLEDDDEEEKDEDSNTMVAATEDNTTKKEEEEAQEEEAVEVYNDYEEENDLLDPDEEPFDINKQQNPTSLSTTPPKAKPKKKSNTPWIDKFSYDLTKAAEEGHLDPVVGREKEIQRVVEILGRRKKNNPVLIGEPGVGKSAIVEGLAQLITNQETSPMFFNKRLVSLDMTAIVAGTKFRGQFEERIKGVIKELENNPDIIIFIDEIHTIIGAGSGEGTMDAANILKPALARGTIQCIGATTLNEYRNSIEKDGALERRFQKVIVDPTTKEQTLQILQNIKHHYEQHHCVTYTDEALKACVNLADRYITDRYFPDKAIDIIDEVGSRVHINNASIPAPYIKLEKMLKDVTDKKQKAVACQNFEMAASYRDSQANIEKELEEMKAQWQKGDIGEHITVTEEDITHVVSLMTGVPAQRMAEAETKRLKEMAGKLKSEVIAQDDAINKMVKAIQRNRVGLRDPNHPIGAFMFLGPTGVGKTYLAKKLAEEMFGSTDALIRIDMSEYAEEHNASRLIGAPPGYVGFGEGGQLTEKVRRKPYCIVLLDEIEKAGGKIFNLLLQMLDEGRMTDGNGRLIDFRNTIVIMTSNAGTRQLKDFGRGVGFNAGGLSGGIAANEQDKEYARSIIQKSLSKQFAPEFLNRLDEIITFDQLDLEAIKRIINLELGSLIKRIEGMGYHLQITEKAKEMVAKKGYDVQFGARPLKRAIQNYIEDGVCEILLSGNLNPGDTICVGKNSKKEELTFKAVKQPIC